MLILSRRTDESIIIADDIKVTVLGVVGKQVRLGIDAPADISVHREEIYLKLEESNQNKLLTPAPKANEQ
ncbi:UNVERIFIED_CONTAM: hypothetical protein GTU68_053069 [Idotea baltica]|nr:hypothetical protein [Idotea baltica]